MKEEKTTPLHQRMIEDMHIRGLCEKTQQGHIRCVKHFSAFSRTIAGYRHAGCPTAPSIPIGRCIPRTAHSSRTATPILAPTRTVRAALTRYVEQVHVESNAAARLHCEKAGWPIPPLADLEVWPGADFEERGALGWCQHAALPEGNLFFIRIWLGLSDAVARAPATVQNLTRTGWLESARITCHEVAHQVTGVFNDPRLSETAEHAALQLTLERLLSIDAANEGILRACALAQRFEPVRFQLGDVMTPGERLAAFEAAPCQGYA